MEFEWDEAKRLVNAAKHGLDFRRAVLLFMAPHIVGSARNSGGEMREMITGRLDDVSVTIVFTRRGTVIRIISMRRARRGERQQYQALFGH